MSMPKFIEMLVQANCSFSVRWCYGEEKPCWEVSIYSEDKKTSANFTFRGGDRVIDSVFVD